MKPGGGGFVSSVPWEVEVRVEVLSCHLARAARALIQTGHDRDGNSRVQVGERLDRVLWEVIDREAESETSTTLSMHPSLGRPYTPSLQDDFSKAEADVDHNSLRKDSTDLDPI